MAVRLNLDKPRWSQDTYEGRAKHFFSVTDPRTIMATDDQLDAAKALVSAYRLGKEASGTTEEQVWGAKKLYDSAFHPQTGEKQFLPGRMSFQVPGNMVIVGCMMTFYRSTPAVVFWQWMNQSFNAVVNYTNRNASVGITNEQLATAYGLATSASVVTAVGLNRLIASSPALSSGIVGRLVPLAAVAAANCVNIPCMRQRELVEGINIMDSTGETVGSSKEAAKWAILQVIPSRVAMAAPAMFIPPVIMNKLEPSALFRKSPWLTAPVTVALTGLCLVFSTPLACALFPQASSIKFEDLEAELKTQLTARYTKLGRSAPSEFFYNKGL